MKLITGKVGGILIETQDIILGDCVVSMDSDSLIFRPDGATKAQLKDNITFIPPQTESTVSTNPYDFTVGDLFCAISLFGNKDHWAYIRRMVL
jgi:hypothetical protein